MAATMKRAPWFLAVIVGGMFGGALTQLLAPQPAWAAERNELKANRLVLVDHHNQKRVVMGFSGNREERTFLDMYDDNNKLRLSITVYPGRDNPNIRFYDRDERELRRLP